MTRALLFTSATLCSLLTSAPLLACTQPQPVGKVSVTSDEDITCLGAGDVYSDEWESAYFWRLPLHGEAASMCASNLVIETINAPHGFRLGIAKSGEVYDLEQEAELAAGDLIGVHAVESSASGGLELRFWLGHESMTHRVRWRETSSDAESLEERFALTDEIEWHHITLDMTWTQEENPYCEEDLHDVDVFEPTHDMGQRDDTGQRDDMGMSRRRTPQVVEPEQESEPARERDTYDEGCSVMGRSGRWPLPPGSLMLLCGFMWGWRRSRRRAE